MLTRAFVLPALPFRGRSARPVGCAWRWSSWGTWVKLGQMLALRFDLLPAPYCDELFQLLNEVAPFPYAQVGRSSARSWATLPRWSSAPSRAQPFAAASIGQVHRAVLPTGQAVAVKVQRPQIRQILRTDIALMYAVARCWTGPPPGGDSQPGGGGRVRARWTADELDYLVEARQAVLLYEQARGERERIARVYREYTTSRVLTSELIDGIP